MSWQGPLQGLNTDKTENIEYQEVGTAVNYVEFIYISIRSVGTIISRLSNSIRIVAIIWCGAPPRKRGPLPGHGQICDEVPIVKHDFKSVRKEMIHRAPTPQTLNTVSSYRRLQISDLSFFR